MFAFAAAEELVGKEARGAADTGRARGPEHGSLHSQPLGFPPLTWNVTDLLQQANFRFVL